MFIPIHGGGTAVDINITGEIRCTLIVEILTDSYVILTPNPDDMAPVSYMPGVSR